MPKGPKGEKRPADMIGAAVKRIAYSVSRTSCAAMERIEDQNVN